MTGRAWVETVTEELRRGKRRASMVALGLTVGVTALIYFLALGNGVEKFVTQKLIKDLPAEEIEVTVPETDIGPLRLSRPGLLSKPMHINDELIDKIRNIELDSAGGKIKPVNAIWRRMDASFPASITGDLLGVPYGTDTAVTGVDAGMVADDVDKEDFIYKPGAAYVPVLIPEALLEVYNTAFAKAQGLPGMSPSFLKGKHFNIHLGASSISRGGGYSTERGVIAGLTDRGTLLGVIAPIDFVVKWNRKIGKNGSDNEYSSIIVSASDARYVSGITDAVRKMGYRARASTGLAERVGGMVALITAGLAILAAVIIAVAGLNAFGLFKLAAWERRSVAGLWMALGATPGEIKSLIMAEAVVVGAISGVVGSAAAFFACVATNIAASKAAGSIPIFPSQPALIQFEYLLIGMAATVVVAVAAAYPSASALARTDPSDILASER